MAQLSPHNPHALLAQSSTAALLHMHSMSTGFDATGALAALHAPLDLPQRPRETAVAGGLPYLQQGQYGTWPSCACHKAHHSTAAWLTSLLFPQALLA
jgi:hypothetical protein